MFCPNCGSSMSDNATFCPNCGYKHSNFCSNNKGKSIFNNLFKGKVSLIIVGVVAFIFIPLLYNNFIIISTQSESKTQVEESQEDEILSLTEQIRNTKVIRQLSADIDIDNMPTVKFGSYPQTDITGNTKDPIEWIVLNKKDNQALLLSKYVLYYSYYYPYQKRVFWKDSSIREWLNKVFYNDAFSDYDKNYIYLVDISTDSISTEDHVFLLEKRELEATIISEKQRITKGTKYANNFLRDNSMVDVDWWLRDTDVNQLFYSIGKVFGEAFYVTSHGETNDLIYHSRVEQYNGVRPAILVAY